jgi:hypothetical protein
MNKNISEIIKVAEALDGATTDVRTLIAAAGNTNTDRFYAPGIERKLCFVVTGVSLNELINGTLLEGETVTLAMLEATSAAGAGSRAVTDRDAVAITTTITGAVNAVQAILTHVAFAATDNFTVNGVNFTYDVAGYDADLRPLSYANRADIVTAVNAHFTDITASNGTAGTAVLFTSTNPGQVGITLTEDIIDGGAFAASTQFIGYVDVDASQLDVANSFDFAGINILNSGTGNAYFNCMVLMGDARYNPAPGPGR